MKHERVRIAWVMEPDHPFKYVVGNVKPKRSAEQEAMEANKKEGKIIAFIVSADEKSKPR